MFPKITNITQVETNLSTSTFFRNTGTIYLALSVATTFLVTVLITYRIVSIQVMNRTALGPQDNSQLNTGGSITRVLEIVVESAMLYSISALVLLVLLAKGDVTYRYAQSVVSQVTGIAPTLILARITLGFARPTASWRTTGIESSIVFTSGPGRSVTLSGSHGMQSERVFNDGSAASVEESK